MESEKTEDFDCKIFDDAALVHILKPNVVETFQKYAESIFVRFLQRALQSVLIEFMLCGIVIYQSRDLQEADVVKE